VAPMTAGIFAGLCYEIVFAKNASIDKAVAFLQNSNYDTNEKEYFIITPRKPKRSKHSVLRPRMDGKYMDHQNTLSKIECGLSTNNGCLRMDNDGNRLGETRVNFTQPYEVPPDHYHDMYDPPSATECEYYSSSNNSFNPLATDVESTETAAESSIDLSISERLSAI